MIFSTRLTCFVLNFCVQDCQRHIAPGLHGAAEVDVCQRHEIPLNMSRWSRWWCSEAEKWLCVTEVSWAGLIFTQSFLICTVTHPLSALMFAFTILPPTPGVYRDSLICLFVILFRHIWQATHLETSLQAEWFLQGSGDCKGALQSAMQWEMI